MQTVRVALGDRVYPVHIGRGLLARGELVRAHLAQPRVAIVTNPIVAALYLERFAGALDAAGIAVVRVLVPDGEEHKSWETLNTIFDALIESRCDRATAIVALGGGVIGDLAGFAAAVYQRGVAYIQVPTTLLAQVDSSVGGKTAINHPRAKNMIGAFHQPLLVLADMDTLATLPEREFRSGLAEVIKHGLIRDAEFVDWLERNMQALLARDPEALAHAVRRSVEIKAQIVARDEREAGERALLNYGHTFGHAIETGLGYGTWLHGEAVAAGMVLAADLSCRRGMLCAEDARRIRRLLERAGLPVVAPGISAAQMLELMASDKKTRAGQLRFVLLERIGSARLEEGIPVQQLEQTLQGEAAH